MSPLKFRCRSVMWLLWTLQIKRSAWRPRCWPDVRRNWLIVDQNEDDEEGDIFRSTLSSQGCTLAPVLPGLTRYARGVCAAELDQVEVNSEPALTKHTILHLIVGEGGQSGCRGFFYHCYLWRCRCNFSIFSNGQLVKKKKMYFLESWKQKKRQSFRLIDLYSSLFLSY